MAQERKQQLGYLLASALVGLACASAPIEGVVRPESEGGLLQSLPGPMPGFGPFDSYSDALIAACPLILSKPNATAGPGVALDERLRWRLSTEYCGWLYYTPDHKYEMSMLTDQSRMDAPNQRKSCELPPRVDDQRYSQGSLKYIFALHNHPFGSTLSDHDIRFIVSAGQEHGFEASTRTGKVRLAVIAFFSNSSQHGQPACDGFFQYIPLTGQILRWSNTGRGWSCEQTGAIVWDDAVSFHIEERKASCLGSPEVAP
jgi:hypothetical protein